MARADIGLRSERGPILLALMLASALVAVDSTIIATAVPSVVTDIGGAAHFPWLFSIYLLAQAVTVPVYGKLADVFGRKPIILVGIGLFLVGSIWCSCAWSMTVLIVARLLQGAGAGAIQPIAVTIVGDIYSVHERARVQGYLAGVWGVCSVIGPAIGGVFSEFASWRWIFVVNIPVCLAAASMLSRAFHERVERRRAPVDLAGAALLTVGSTMVILAVLEGGQSWPWLSVPGLGSPGIGLLLLGLFVRRERRVPVPILPLWVFTRRLLLTSSIVSACVGAILYGLSSFVPTFVQNGLGFGPVVAGFAVSMLTVGWPLTASQSGRIYLHIGFRGCALIGSAVACVGCALLVLVTRSSTVWQVGVTCFAIGLGMGLIAAPTLIAAQSSVGWGERGVVTGNNMFCRALGSALGVAVLGAVANAARSDGADPASPNGSTAALTSGTHLVFIGLVVVAGVMTIAVLAMPQHQRVRGTAGKTDVPADEPWTDLAGPGST